MAKSYGLLEGKKGVIFGALVDSSLAWKIAERVHEEGGQFALSNAPVARRLGSLDALAERTNSTIHLADATDDDYLASPFEEEKQTYGQIDFIVHSIEIGRAHV